MATLRGRAARNAFLRAVALQRRVRERSGTLPAPDAPLAELDAAAVMMRDTLEKLTRFNRPVSGVRLRTTSDAPTPTSVLVPDSDTDGRMVLYLHGGAYVAGSRRTHVGLASGIARVARADVVLPEYRLAPEHRFPAAVEDALAAYRWMVDDHGVAPERIVVAGDSAGGGLAFALALALKDAGEPLPAGLVGLSPWTDLTASGETITSHNELDPWLDGEYIAAVGRVYAGDQADHPYASPLFGDLAGLPPVLVHVGSDEVLLDDARRLVARARAAGVDASLGVFEGMWHVFQAIVGVPEAGRSLREIGGFVRRVTTAAPYAMVGGSRR